MSHQTHYR